MKEVIKYLKRKPNEELIQNKCINYILNHSLQALDNSYTKCSSCSIDDETAE